MGEASPIQIAEVIANFQYNGRLVRGCAYGNGHINDTYLLTFQISGMGSIKVILQKMNKDVFGKPEELMENVMGVTAFLREQIIKNGGDPERETLNVIPAYDNKPYYRDSYGDYWRSYKFITDATSYDVVEKPEHFYESALAFGNFQCMLADYPAETLNETIEGFHDTKARFAVFKKAVEEDVMERAASVRDEIQFVLDREEVADYFGDLQAKGELPIRAGGKLLVIDGGFCTDYHKKTGIAGYTLIYNSHGLRIMAHQPFETIYKAMKENLDIESESQLIETEKARVMVKDTDIGKEIYEHITDLELLLQGYRSGEIKER